MKKLIATTCIGICALQTMVPVTASDELPTPEIIQDFNLTANFNADGNVDLKWIRISPDEFEYYQIVRSEKNAEPMYPEDDYIYFTTNKSDLTYEDDDIPDSTLYYRICTYAGAHTYCSPTEKVVRGVTAVTPSLNAAEFTFKDTETHWAKSYITSLATHCGVLGYKDSMGRLLGIFKPDEPIKRAELLKMLSDCSELSPENQDVQFSDVEQGSWYEEALSIALKAGWVQGYADGTFRPFINMNRAEGLKMILRARFSEELIGNDQTKFFNDVDISSWYQKYIAFAYVKGFVSGKQSGKFLPGDSITRAEAAKIIATVFGWNAPVLPPANTNQNTTNPGGGLSSTKLSSTCSVFPSDNPWNRDISKDPIHVNSANYIASILKGKTKLHPDFGSNPDYGIPYSIVDSSQKKVPINVVSYADESDLGSYPIPDNQKVEAGSDHHVLVADKDNCKLYELYGAEKTSTGWNADSAAIFDLASNILRPDYWTSADAAGLPIFPGLVKYDEVKSGKITHALRFTVSKTQKAFIHPATHFASSSTDANLPPMGLRLRLKADFDISSYTGDTKVILEALKTYGMIVADNGSDWFISGATDSRWNDEDLEQLKEVPGSAFEAVESGPLIK
ncbi:MAG: S-layer homology domain-containing protein [Candidatus Gracilibacteria bacterium]